MIPLNGMLNLSVSGGLLQGLNWKHTRMTFEVGTANIYIIAANVLPGNARSSCREELEGHLLVKLMVVQTCEMRYISC